MAVDWFDHRCYACRRKVPRGEIRNHHCSGDDISAIDDEPEVEWVEDRWEECDEVDRLNYGLELMESE